MDDTIRRQIIYTLVRISFNRTAELNSPWTILYGPRVRLSSRTSVEAYRSSYVPISGATLQHFVVFSSVLSQKLPRLRSQFAKR